MAKHSERSDEARSGRGWPLKDLVNKKAVAAAWVVQSSGIDEGTRRRRVRAVRAEEEGGRQSVSLKVQLERRGNSGFWEEKVDGNTSFQLSALKRVETR